MSSERSKKRKINAIVNDIQQAIEFEAQRGVLENSLPPAAPSITSDETEDYAGAAIVETHTQQSFERREEEVNECKNTF